MARRWELPKGQGKPVHTYSFVYAQVLGVTAKLRKLALYLFYGSDCRLYSHVQCVLLSSIPLKHRSRSDIQILSYGSYDGGLVIRWVPC